MIDWRELLAAAAIIIVLLGAMFLVTGCAGQTLRAICGVRPIGQSEGGIPYLAISCEPQK